MRCIVVHVKIVSGVVSMMDFASWKFYLSDAAGGAYVRVGSMVHTHDGPDRASEGEWVFDVPVDSSSFRFHLPDGTVVPLDTLMP